MGRLKTALVRYERQRELDKAKAGRVEKKQQWKQKKPQKNDTVPQKKWIPFSAEDIVCLVGEGDFSFANAVLEEGLAAHVVATSLDSETELAQKYSQSAAGNIERIHEYDNANILHGIDATQLTRSKALVKVLGSLVEASSSLVFVFNFPHLGNSVRDQDRNIRQHQELLLEFFKQISKGWPKAQAVVTLFDGEPYASWEIKRLARIAGFKLERSGRFMWDAYPGYTHQLTSKEGGTTSKSQRQRMARSFAFGPWSAPKDMPKKVSADSDSDSDD